jgi:hypothetical protein
VAFLAALFGCGDGNDSNAVDFEPGQIWTYDVRRGEEQSRLTVCLVEGEGGRRVVHVAVDRLRLANPNAPSGFSDRIGHMAFHEDSLRKSVRTLEQTSESVPAFGPGYESWQRAGGIAWDVSVAQAISKIEGVLVRAKKR